MINTWIAVDGNGSEFIYNEKPVVHKHSDSWGFYDHEDDTLSAIRVPKGTAEKLTGKPLAFRDGCIRLI